MSVEFWLNDPKILLKNSELKKIWIKKDMNLNDKLNIITRLVLLLSFVGYMVTSDIRILIAMAVTLIVIVAIYKMKSKPQLKSILKKREGFDNFVKNVKKSVKYTEPTKKNPLMNVMLPEIQYNPKREEAEPYSEKVENDINEKAKEMVVENFGVPGIDKRLFKDLGDNFEFDRSMRNWYTTANTRVPNDQKSFAEFCYGDMISCKEVNENALTRSYPPQWINS